MKKELQHVSCSFSLFSVNRAGLTKIVDPSTVPPDEYQDDAPPVASRVYAMQADAGLGGNGNGNRTDVAIQELTNTLRELMHITRETSNRVRGLEERVSRVEMEAVSVNTDAMSGATTNAETVSGGEIGEIG